MICLIAEESYHDHLPSGTTPDSMANPAKRLIADCASMRVAGLVDNPPYVLGHHVAHGVEHDACQQSAIFDFRNQHIRTRGVV